MRRETLHYVQVGRFLAAGLVLITHTADLLYPNRGYLFGFRWDVGVDMFFVISGFIMAYLARGCFGAPGAARHFLIRRMVRIAPPYWFFTTLMIAAALLVPAAVNHTRLGGPEIATSYLFVPWPRGDGKINPLLSQGWTLNYEAFFYVAFAAALLFRRGLWGLAAAFVLLVCLHPFVSREWFALRFWSRPIILDFLAGILIAHPFLQGRRLHPAVSAVLAAAGLSVAAVPWTVGIAPRFAHEGVAAILVMTALILAREPKRIGGLGRLLRAGGDASYALYLSHTFTVNAAVLAWRKAAIGPPWLVMGPIMAGAIVLAWLFYRLVERPATDALQRLAGTRPLRDAETVAP